MKSIILLGSILFFNSFFGLEPQTLNPSYSYIINNAFENSEYTTNKNKSDDIITKSSTDYNKGNINVIELPTPKDTSIESITLDV
ncbi:hypothetical protein [Clostridium sardiniense]|uniref:hypothetical protein n=1 Tax=Clostridium sardiniense TaxID=29369 RepID=UPI00195E0BEB|nr:hypothetical protein [Clostridium sardiniense]MBM7833195.1 hypothetical protein [Clostridium sardiniense]